MSILFHKLTVGSIVKADIGNPSTTKLLDPNKEPELTELVVLGLVYFYESQIPTIKAQVVNLGLEDTEYLIIHGSRVELVEYNPTGKLDISYKPEGFLTGPLYREDDFVFNVLFNKFGHRLSWKDKLYDIGGIKQEIKELTDSGLLKAKKKIKNKVLAIAPKYLVKRKDFQEESEADMKSF